MGALSTMWGVRVLGLTKIPPRVMPWFFVLLWSSGFVAAKYVHEYAEPFTFLTLRYALSTALLVAVAAAQHQTWSLTRRQVRDSAITGLLLHTVYIGGVFYAISLGVSAGITSVIVSMQPVLVALLAIPVLGETFKPIEGVGLLLGVAGVSLLLLPKLFQGDMTPQFSTAGITACVIALLGTTGGYLTQKRSGGDIPFVTGTAVQYAVTAVVFLVLSLATETREIDWQPQFLLATAWIVLALSIGSIFMLFELLKSGSAAGVSSLYYLVPPSAAIQAYVLFHETIPPVGLVGMGLAALGVMLVMRATGGGH